MAVWLWYSNPAAHTEVLDALTPRGIADLA